MIRLVKHSAGALALAIAIVGVAMLSGEEALGQGQFFAPCGTVQLADSSPGAASNINAAFGIGVGDNCVYEPATDDKNMYNFGGVVNFTPTDFTVKKDSEVPDGTEVGTLVAQSTLGLLNNPCQNGLQVSFKFYEATTNVAGPQISALPPGTADRMKPLGAGTPPAGATAWPDFLPAVFDQADLTKLRARYLGVAKVAAANNLTVILNFMIFEPGAKVSNIINLDPRLGYASVTALQDSSQPASNQDFINDFCSPLLTATTLTSAVRKNPASAGVYNFVTYTASLLDPDADGYENALDTCPYTPNVGNPRVQPDLGDAGEQPADGIDKACDPDPLTGRGTSGVGIANSDEDGDLWMNRNDNCPLISNADQKDTDKDGIGDACDENRGATATETRDGWPPQVKCNVLPVQVGTGGSQPAVDPLTLQPCNPAGVLPQTETATPVGQTPTPTLPPGATARPTTAPISGGGTGVGTGPVTGIGSLSPTGANVPDWAVLLTALGFVGLLGGVTLVGARVGKRR